MRVEELAYEIMFGLDGDLDKAVILIQRFMAEQSKQRLEVELPFDSDNFRAVWDRWLQYRSDIKKPYRSKLSVESALKQLGSVSELSAIKMIEKSISNGWQGLFEIHSDSIEKKTDYKNTDYTLEK